MFRSLPTIAFGLAVAAALVLASAARANHTVPARGSADGQVLIQINPTSEEPVGVQVWIAKGRVTVAGAYMQMGVTFFTMDGLVSGFNVLTTSDGATALFHIDGIFYPIGADKFGYELNAVLQSATGRLAGYGCTADVSAVLNARTGSFHYNLDGDWTVPHGHRR